MASALGTSHPYVHNKHCYLPIYLTLVFPIISLSRAALCPLGEGLVPSLFSLSVIKLCLIQLGEVTGWEGDQKLRQPYLWQACYGVLGVVAFHSGGICVTAVIMQGIAYCMFGK